MGFGKWLGGALGWAVGGPIGGIIGFALGAIADDKSTSGVRQSNGPKSQNAYGQHRHQTRPGDFAS
ncbi:MAG: molecular chaperone DjiA, partial [Flavobacteriales bacterium]